MSEARITPLDTSIQLLGKVNLSQPWKVKHSVSKCVSLPFPHHWPCPALCQDRKEREGGQGWRREGLCYSGCRRLLSPGRASTVGLCGCFSSEGSGTGCHLDWRQRGRSTGRLPTWSTGHLPTWGVLLVPPPNPAWTWTGLFPCVSLIPVISNLRAGPCESRGVPSDSVSGCSSAGGFSRPRAAPACPGNVS